MRTVPVNQSTGPFAEGCEPTRLMSIFVLRGPGSRALSIPAGFSLEQARNVKAEEQHATWHSGFRTDGRQARHDLRTRRARCGIQLCAQPEKAGEAGAGCGEERAGRH